MQPATNLLPLALLLATLAACNPTNDVVRPGAEPPAYRIVGYVMGSRTVDLSRIDATKLTHINYAFANVRDNQVVLERDNDAANLARLNTLKERNPTLKILLSVGGWAWSDHFSDAALTEASRETFARSAIDLLTTHTLDGIDLDWEYPGQPGEDNTYRPEDKQNFTLLLQTMRAHLDARSAQDGRSGADAYLLTIAVGTNAAYVEHTEMDVAQRSLDFVNLMTYDFAGSWTPTAGHHTNLYPSAADGAPERAASLEVERFLQAGVPAHKLVLGVAFYGRGWSGVQAAQNGLYQPYTTSDGAYPYHVLVSEYIDKNGFQRYWDDAARAPYLWHAGSTRFITYEDEESLRHKAEFVKAGGLGGVMYWEHSHDPGEVLLTTLYRSLH
jgi:chitinase